MHCAQCAINDLKSYVESSWGGLNDSFEAAISALEEKIEREKGCDFCRLFDFSGASAKIDLGKYAHIYLASSSYRYKKDEQFVFCPECGKKL